MLRRHNELLELTNKLYMYSVYDIEVVVNIDNNQAYFGLALTKHSLHKRSIEHFGPTTLRATICASLLQ